MSASPVTIDTRGFYRGGDQSLGELLGLGYITFRKDKQQKQQ